jgi:hypothetical protein
MPVIENTLTFEITPERIRNAANVASKRDLNRAEAEQFLHIFREEFEDAMMAAFRGVIQRHFGVKQ